MLSEFCTKVVILTSTSAPLIPLRGLKVTMKTQSKVFSEKDYSMLMLVLLQIHNTPPLAAIKECVFYILEQIDAPIKSSPSVSWEDTTSALPMDEEGIWF